MSRSASEAGEQGSLVASMPDLVITLRRDGTVLEYAGGRAVTALPGLENAVGRPIEAAWPVELAQVLRSSALRAVAARGTIDATIEFVGRKYDVRATAQRADRAICVIRPCSPDVDFLPERIREDLAGPYRDRQSFFLQLQQSMALAVLRERPVSIAVVHVDGVLDLSSLLDSGVAEEVMGIAIKRFVAAIDGPPRAPAWYMTQIQGDVLLVLFESTNRPFIERLLGEMNENLRLPVPLGDAAYYLKPYAGVARLGQDAATRDELIRHARAASAEARRVESAGIRFYTDTLEMRALARIDMAGELRAAVLNKNIRLRYKRRVELASGRLVALVGYLHWAHPLRGAIPPQTFLRLADATGLSVELSRCAFKGLIEDAARLKAEVGPKVRLSFGALRQHLLDESFMFEVSDSIGAGAVPADFLELRIAERSFLAGSSKIWGSLAGLGVQIVVDEVGRDISSFAMLSRSQVHGLQLDRSWVVALDSDPAALKICRAAVGVADAFGLTSIATGIDGGSQRGMLLDLGCAQGMGDLYDGAAQPSG